MGPILIENKILDPINLNSVLLLVYVEMVNGLVVRYNVRGVMNGCGGL